MPELSAIVITHNEAANIGECLDSVAFCDEIGLDYVSCSPYRVPIARLAAAQAALASA